MREPSDKLRGAAPLQLTDFDAVGAVFTGWDGRILQLTSGRFEGSIRASRGDTVRAVAAEGNQRLRLLGRDASGALGIYPLNANMAAATWMGQRYTAGQIFVGGADDEIDYCSARKFAGSVAFISPRTLAAAAHALLQAPDADVIPDSGARSTSPAAFADVERRLGRLLRSTASGHSPERFRLEQECLRAVVTALYPSPTEKLLPPGQRAVLLRRAHDVMLAHLGEPWGMIDLCRELGAKDRTLRMAFRERFGVGPMTYFRYLRLHGARSRIKGDAQVAIAAAAREFGFQHLGNFAADYRRLFGMRPSETPRR